MMLAETVGGSNEDGHGAPTVTDADGNGKRVRHHLLSTTCVTPAPLSVVVVVLEKDPCSGRQFSV